MIKLTITLICCLAFFGGSCESKPGGQNSASQSNTQQAASNIVANPAVSSETPPVAGPNICGLIENSEVASVQGAQVQSVVPGSQTSGALAISQCYYMVTSGDGSKNLSVHLQVMRDGGDGAKAPAHDGVKEFWEEKFKEGKKRDEDKDEEEEEGGSKPQPVAGVGDEAFWMGDGRAGALYALKRDKIVRVSIGGADDAKIKLEKSKTLARHALMRLK